MLSLGIGRRYLEAKTIKNNGCPRKHKSDKNIRRQSFIILPFAVTDDELIRMNFRRLQRGKIIYHPSELVINLILH